MLEDDHTYVLRKALRGLALSPSEAAARAGLPENEVLSFSRGRFSPETARTLASALGLDPEAFARHPGYQPAPQEHPFIHRLILPFGEDHVNAWLVSHGDTRLLFDTGDDRFSCADALRSLGVIPDAVLVTHGHPDHIAGLPSFTAPKYGPEISGAENITAGSTLQIGDIHLRIVDLSGHFNPAVGYLIEGLAKPILIPGDAIFAGSIGGCDPEHYHHAISRIETVLSDLDPATIILPGHGPATTVAEESSSNPFLKSRSDIPV